VHTDTDQATVSCELRSRGRSRDAALNCESDVSGFSDQLPEPGVVGATRAGGGHDPMVWILGRRGKYEAVLGARPAGGFRFPTSWRVGRMAEFRAEFSSP
jgi:hypothetical protein